MQQSELNYFKDILLRRKNQIINNINNSNIELSGFSSDDLRDDADFASADHSTMAENAIILQQQRELSEIEISLGKIASGIYGICEMCEDPIGFQRLKAKPHATYCIDCRVVVDKTKG
ncbi:MAG: RNA polymerase-binding protein DksA [Sulfurimonas sp.]|nr:RNA polymerase-binding protein DksA [Sulfurimonadaceae bacterium]